MEKEKIIQEIDENIEWIMALRTVAACRFIDTQGDEDIIVPVVYGDLLELKELLENVRDAV